MQTAQLHVEESSEALPFNEVELNHETTFLGRGALNRIVLPDLAVGRQHASIDYVDHRYVISDLGSKNFTYLNETPLEPNSVYELNDGDEIRICQYRLRFKRVEEMETVWEASNPYVEDVAELRETLEKIAVNHGELDGVARLRFETAMKEECDALLGSNLGEVVGRLLMNGKAPAENGQADLPASGPGSPELERVFPLMVRLVQAPKGFRSEFFGHSDFRKSPIYSESTAGVKEYLTDASQTPQERELRAEEFAKAVSGAMMHQISLLSAYKAAVISGTDEILTALRPEHLEHEVASSSWFKKLPLFKQYYTFKAYREMHKQLWLEENSKVEESYYRKGFLRGYEQTMDSLQTAKVSKPPLDRPAFLGGPAND